MKRRQSVTQQEAESLAIQVLSFLAEEPDRLARFLALSGIDAGAIRSAATQPEFLLGVLDHVVGDEALLLAFAAQFDLEPAAVDRAHRVLAGRHWERDVP